MYLEFWLPNGQRPAGDQLLMLKHELVSWSQKYNIPYTEKTVKLTHRVCFNHPNEYTFFMMSWTGECRNFTLINIP